MIDREAERRKEVARARRGPGRGVSTCGRFGQQLEAVRRYLRTARLVTLSMPEVDSRNRTATARAYDVSELCRDAPVGRVPQTNLGE